MPPVFVGVAYDSGGVASGPMTTTFLLPFAMGACTAIGGNVVTDAFGIVALVALTPLIAIQVMGLVYSRKTKSPAGCTFRGVIGRHYNRGHGGGAMTVKKESRIWASKFYFYYVVWKMKRK